jgi:hypothetical protein
VTIKERTLALAATLIEQRSTVADLERSLQVARTAVGATQNEIHALHFEVWLEDDRVAFPTPEHGRERIETHGYREREVRWVEGRTEKGSIRLATEIRSPTRKPERRTTYTLRVGTADYLAACAEYGLTP